MKWPWIVSGNRHRRLLRKYRELRKANKALLTAMDPVNLVEQALPDPTSADAEKLTDYTGKLTKENLKAIFRRETQQPRVGRG